MKTLFRFALASLLLASILLLNMSHARSLYAATINVACDVAELIAAINTANGTAEADVLELAQDCVYTLNAVDNELGDGHGPTGLPRIVTDITIHGNNARIERSLEIGDPFFRFLLVEETGVLTIEHLTLAHGQPGWKDVGGWFYGYSGGAIISNGTLNIKNSVFTNNRVPDDEYGGWGGTIASGAGDVTIQDSIFELGAAAIGGAIGKNGGTLTIRNTVFQNNTSLGGSALAAGGTTKIFSSVFRKNNANIEDDGSGGPGGIDNTGTMTIQDSTFARNVGERGGAIWNKGKLTIFRSTFVRNKAFWGGGIRNFGTLRVVNSTFFKNSARYNGGGIINNNTLQLYNVTFASNSAGNAGGNLTMDNLFVKPEAEVWNTIFSNGIPQNCIGVLTDKGGNLRFPATDKSCIGKVGNPKLDTLKNNGGETKTLALLPDSAARNLGDALVCKAGLVNNRDQRGVKRVKKGDTACDSGAYEVD